MLADVNITKVHHQLSWPCKQVLISRESGSNYCENASRCEYYGGQPATIVDVNITRVRPQTVLNAGSFEYQVGHAATVVTMLAALMPDSNYYAHASRCEYHVGLAASNCCHHASNCEYQEGQTSTVVTMF